ncbi:LPXTG cell wall anchor domain-containing protein [Rahnella sp. C60]|uniref:Uncharacterized protein n=2 Tax=Rahnella TaxID=34037 RepID=H2IPA7_RAHAC|nr:MULTISPECIES: LPXTG cell wall anchor domain-containing protein [Rahnella]AEX52354.1 hypothetical protein Rahaq2_2502 [Rahnella aquatilis CIP 78.65 = ATCC 33071]MBU9810698.1 LPXTG cell wall anchor domain-containing protein [Rahnella perminowiae]MBU9813513.1 LPXTG cell wall anchor domain-containing protein [Rahnella perminowiae]MBU9824120.1 LPXTG cell wall anchor domain-containing protein [Rahnella perminowiae]MBU9833367.1 LPXTG cell wall anchor domain-containing protein [Rahnella perminowiae
MATPRQPMTVARRLLRNSLILLVIGIVATIHGLVVGSPETPPGEMAPQLMLGIWFIFIGCVMALISGLVIRNKKKKGEL